MKQEKIIFMPVKQTKEKIILNFDSDFVKKHKTFWSQFYILDKRTGIIAPTGKPFKVTFFNKDLKKAIVDLEEN